MALVRNEETKIKGSCCNYFTFRCSFVIYTRLFRSSKAIRYIDFFSRKAKILDTQEKCLTSDEVKCENKGPADCTRLQSMDQTHSGKCMALY